MSRQLISKGALDRSFPCTPSTLYVGRSKDLCPWLLRKGPSGRQGRYPWIDVLQLNNWAAERRLKFRLHSVETSRVEVQH